MKHWFAMGLMFLNLAAFAQSNVIYDKDDRMDYYQASPKLQTMADSTMTILFGSDFKQTNDYYEFVGGMPYAEWANVCKEEKFSDQLEAAFCSSFLIGKDLLVTAGHCVFDSIQCKSLAYVFDFHMLGPQDLKRNFQKDDVYFCKELLFSVSTDEDEDFAIIRLDRPTNRAPVRIAKEELANDANLVLIGNPVGLSTKIAPNGKLRSIKKSIYVTELDSYKFNSGSAVFNQETGEVVGVLVRGEQDFDFTNQHCNVSKVCLPGECRGEDVTKIGEVINKLPLDLKNEILAQ